MTHHQEQNSSALADIVNLVVEQGCDGLPAALAALINEAMKIERARALQAQPYQRCPDRQGYANGFKPKNLQSRVGPLALSVPQVRGGIAFYPNCLEKGLRSERALINALAQMYVQGVSTRRVAAILTELCGTDDITSTQVSRAAATLDAELELWRQRPLSAITYLILDARYEKVRVDGQVRNIALFTATGIAPDGKRTILGLSTCLSEAETHWRSFLQNLLQRGLRGLHLITSDNHPGLTAALRAVLPSVPWQRCQFHLQQNAAHHCPKESLKADLAKDLRRLFDTTSRAEADTALRDLVARHRKERPALADWLEQNVPESLTVFSLPEPHRVRLRTSNAQENLNRQIRRRTCVVGIFPNPESLLRLSSAILVEISEEWENAQQPYLKMNPIKATDPAV
jgi:putative transposase